MVEYWNGEDEQGDFESVLSLIDAYDLLQSDRMNDKQQFVDALLLLYGCTLETDERGRTPGQQLREDKVLSLPDSDARAEWLCKQLNEADTEVLRSSIVSDIHKMSMVPDMTDEAFSGNVSGVAMRYKLLGLEQLTKIKERWFREALRERMRRMSAFLQRKGYPGLDAAQVRMSFARSLPVNQLETAQTIEKLRGLVSDDRLIRLAGFLGE
jgi:SPP1 family phage portal protein